MEHKYDCTKDVLEHKGRVIRLLLDMAFDLTGRAFSHDNSKLEDPIEKELFDKWTPELRQRPFGTDEYKQALEQMGEGVKRHYFANRHHPEHFENGVNEMTLVDVMEMVCDWQAAAQAKGAEVDLDYLAERFGLGDQLTNIIWNTYHPFGRVDKTECP